jgi:phosphotransferase system enzyme I (PtsI)
MLLLGLGVRQLSMPPHQLPEIKRVIRGTSLAQARAVAEQALRQETAQAVLDLLCEALRRALPDTPTLWPDRADEPAAALRPVEHGFS